MQSRTMLIAGRLALLALLAMSIVSCDETRRYETMRFFFDGVEPPESQQLADGFVNPNSPVLARGPEGPTWYVHEPTRDCTNCHDTKRQSRAGGKAYLVAPVPTLCHDCHDDPTVSMPNVHGPVAVGQCRQCHNPHKTQVKYLLEKGGVPQLCYSCHDSDSILSIPAHFVARPSACTDCHDPHASTERPLLKEGIHRLNGGYDPVAMISTVMQEYIRVAGEEEQTAPAGQPQAAPAPPPDGEAFDQVLWMGDRLLEQGELPKARAYLAQFRYNQSFTDQEREKIAHVLDLMDRVAGAPAPDVEKAEALEPAAEPGGDDPELQRRRQEIADIFYASMDSYLDGKLMRAREGFVKVLRSGLIPEAMATTVLGYISDIDKRLAERKR